jgi:hypothetical protein
MTAVEFLEDMLKISNKEAYNDLYEVIQQAKEMEKEQIKNAWDNAAIDASYGKKYKNFEDYYNQLSNK